MAARADWDFGIDFREARTALGEGRLRGEEREFNTSAVLGDWYSSRELAAQDVDRRADIGPMADFPAAFDLSTLDGTNGFRLDGRKESDFSGSVSSAGDINGDGFDDIIIGAFAADPGGESYIVLGKAGGFAASLKLGMLDGSNGFRLDGDNGSGISVSSAGDINSDGFGDIIIGAFGEAYVVFGKAGGFDARLDLTLLDGTDGFLLEGSAATGSGGSYSVSSAGDVNGDGFDDIIVGAAGAGRGGESYVVFGRAVGFAASLDLVALDGSNGFRLDGIGRGDSSGYSVSSAGDVNGDGFDDFIVGAFRAGGKDAGESYVVFGKAVGFAASFDFGTLDGANGFRLVGIDAQDYSGCSVSSAGDVNGDGFDDIIIGSFGAGPGGGSQDAGESYVVFGQMGGFAASIDLATLDGANGFRLDGIDENDRSGRSVSSAGDVNGDGFYDILIGANNGGPGVLGGAGESYVVFGKANGFGASFDLAVLDGSNGFRVDGIDVGDNSGRSVSAAGDVNGDGFDDIIIGANYADASGDHAAGESYVIFGRAPTEAVNRIGSDADQTIRGGAFNDTLSGLGGDDTLAGGAGKDKLKGGVGEDTFVLASDAAPDADAIGGFKSGKDVVALDSDVFDLPEGALDPDAFLANTTGRAEEAEDRLIYNSVNGKLFFDADGTGAIAPVLIAKLTEAPPLEGNNFIVI